MRTFTRRKWDLCRNWRSPPIRFWIQGVDEVSSVAGITDCYSLVGGISKDQWNMPRPAQKSFIINPKMELDDQIGVGQAAVANLSGKCSLSILAVCWVGSSALAVWKLYLEVLQLEHKPPPKLWKSHWCVSLTATFSKRRKIGALWSERCDGQGGGSQQEFFGCHPRYIQQLPQRVCCHWLVPC